MNPIDELLEEIRAKCEPDEQSGWLEMRLGTLSLIIRAAMPGILIDFAKYSRNTRNLIYPSDTVVAAYLSQNEQGEK